jgi:hypothetical protein
MDLVVWTCYYFAALVIFDVCVNAVSSATNLVKIRINC